MKKKLDNADNTVLLQVITEQQQTIQKLHQQLEQLQHRLDKMLHLLYGTKSEKKSKFKPEEPAVHSGTPSSKEPKSTPSNSNGRRQLPIDLRRERLEYDLPEEQRSCKCCPLIMQRMGKVLTEQLEFKPGELYVIEHVRIKYSCQDAKAILLQLPYHHNQLIKA
ncbi:MAG: IS66 family transposase zinc-finger binding domain-containing protein [Proteobacteria bacterium]|nr:IS66 family transposase zinc-finger binding domain-containing protein [Pseudomonadota bacterium]